MPLLYFYRHFFGMIGDEKMSLDKSTNKKITIKFISAWQQIFKFKINLNVQFYFEFKIK